MINYLRILDQIFTSCDDWPSYMQLLQKSILHHNLTMPHGKMTATISSVPLCCRIISFSSSTSVYTIIPWRITKEIGRGKSFILKGCPRKLISYLKNNLDFNHNPSLEQVKFHHQSPIYTLYLRSNRSFIGWGDHVVHWQQRYLLGGWYTSIYVPYLSWIYNVLQYKIMDKQI